MFSETFINNLQAIGRHLDLFDTSNEAWWEMNSDNEVIFYNSNFYDNFDITQPKSTLDEWIALIHLKDVACFENYVNQHISDDIERFASQYRVKRFISQYRVKNKSGQYRWIEATAATKYGDNGQLLYMVGSHKDITEAKEYHNRIYNIAYVDELTGLLKRSKLVESLKEMHNTTTGGVLLYIHLNQFRLFNDTFGHNAGNEILATVSDCLKTIFCDEFDLFRVCANEYCVLTNQKITEVAVDILIEALLKLFRQSNLATCDDYVHKLSIGACMLPCEAECEESLISKAKLTMRFAQKHPNMEYAFFDKKKQVEVQKRLYIETGMKAALKNNDFVLKYQPIMSSETGKIESFEALVRWESKTFDEIMPDEFIPVAEKTRDIIELGDFVLKNACLFIRDYNIEHKTRLKIAVNVSVLQLLQKTFIERVVNTVKYSDLKPENIVIEVTESIILDSNAYAKEQILDLRNRGFSVSLDDFGTGYSSLNSFFSIPFTQLKIDKEVISKAMASTEVSAYIRFLTNLCGEKKIEVVAEGIESEDMASKIRSLGVTLLQGYFYSRPVYEKEAFEINVNLTTDEDSFIYTI